MLESTMTVPQRGEAPALAPGSQLLEEVLQESGVAIGDESSQVLQEGLARFVRSILSSPTISRVDAVAVDALIAELDQLLSDQINAIMHAPAFQALESAWRGLKYVVESFDFRENVRLEMLDLRKDELIADFEDAPELVKTGYYRKIYSEGVGVFGGVPVGAICMTYDFDHGLQDQELLKKVAAVSAMAHAPLLANASPSFFGARSFEEVAHLKDLRSVFESSVYATWSAFRDTEDARYVGLCAPRFVLRVPYGEETVPVKSFNFNEEAGGKSEHYLWAPASLAMLTRLADSFARYRWCPNIVGPKGGGLVESLPLHHFKALGEIQTKCPVEVMLTQRRAFELAEEGFIPLEFEKDTNRACFFSAGSTQRPKSFGISAEGKQAEANFRLGTQLPYIFIASRMAHYLKVIMNNEIGTYKERSDLQRELDRWISQYVVSMENPDPITRARRPLREAKVVVEDVEGQPGWYRCGIQIRPHMQLVGVDLTLSLVSKLEKK